VALLELELLLEFEFEAALELLAMGCWPEKMACRRLVSSDSSLSWAAADSFLSGADEEAADVALWADEVLG
jgi:hypothetical protein